LSISQVKDAVQNIIRKIIQPGHLKRNGARSEKTGSIS
jgi:hypothetical protein